MVRLLGSAAASRGSMSVGPLAYQDALEGGMGAAMFSP